MKLTETQACDIWMTALSPLSQRQSRELLWGTDRMQRRALHVLHRAEKKRAKRIRAKRGKSVRPIVRFTPAGFVPDYTEKALFSLVVQIGNDTQIYEPEFKKPKPKASLSQNELWRDSERVLLEDEFGDSWWEYENQSAIDDLSHDDGF